MTESTPGTGGMIEAGKRIAQDGDVLHTRRAVVGLLAGIVAAAAIPGRSAAQTAPATSPLRGASTWDVVVVGAGVFGAWTAWNLQRQGRKVLLVDAWGPGHSRASSGGESRLTRTEYRADELYMRMAWDSLADWRALSDRADSPILNAMGALFFYMSDSKQIQESLALHRELKMPMQLLEHAELAKRYPQIGWDGIVLGLFQPTMGALMARRGVQKVVQEFLGAGGSYRQAAIVPPDAGGTLDSIATSAGDRLRAKQFVFACGPWLPKLFPKEVGTRIVPSRQDVFFFAPAAGDVRFEPEHLPSWVDTDDKDLHYGFPVLEARGFKIAIDVHGPRIDPDTLDRRIDTAALANVRTYLQRRFPALAQRPLAESRVCQYENTASGDFLIDRHPVWENAWLVGGGSGHGFKHGPAVGRYVADVAGGSRKPEPRFALSQHAAQAG